MFLATHRATRIALDVYDACYCCVDAMVGVRLACPQSQAMSGRFHEVSAPVFVTSITRGALLSAHGDSRRCRHTLGACRTAGRDASRPMPPYASDITLGSQPLKNPALKC